MLDLHPKNTDDACILSHLLKEEEFVHCHQLKGDAAQRSGVVSERFLAICQQLMNWWMTEGDVDHQAMQRVLRCTHKREVQGVLDDYKDVDFSDLVHTKQKLAQTLVVCEKGSLDKYFLHS